MRDRDLEHPDISSALRTGYPSEQHQLVCDKCGEPIDYDYYVMDDGWLLCQDCMLDEAVDFLKGELETAAKILNAERRIA